MGFTVSLPKPLVVIYLKSLNITDSFSKKVYLLISFSSLQNNIAKNYEYCRVILVIYNEFEKSNKK